MSAARWCRAEAAVGAPNGALALPDQEARAALSARPPPIIAMSVYLMGDPGLEPPLLRRERQTKH
ncbi:hypothetical protein SAMN05443247_06668 [Bradyrhizobium erythrophlei]|nr:hypothetical protein SAMN05443247_06668 [Bradyrhizobium erythrophlei]